MKNPPFYLNTMNYMFNLDMVGRYNPEKGVVINGIGTSPIWATSLNKSDTSLFKFKTTESGVGPSDQTSFYFKDIPALHFFTGSHEDYHKPSDDADKINFDGIVVISDFILDVIGDLNGKLKLAFTRTKDDEAGSTPRYKISLGVIPDYLYDGKGMRIDGVKEDRPAIKAGIKAGDVVVGIGEVEVSDMKSYMTGLSSLEEGKKTVVKVRRGEKVLEFEVQF
jgi:membrane-associated protease RseP (regulator of RpoE activity)